METQTHVNTGAVKILVEFNGNEISNFDQTFGKKRIIKTCQLKDIVRAEQDISMMENKARYTLFYAENGKNKRFGGMGFSIEGHASQPEFQDFISNLKNALPDHVEWINKAEAKAKTSTKEGVLKFPIKGSLTFLFYTMPMHAGMRGMVVAMKLVFAIFSLFVGLVVITGCIMNGFKMESLLIFLVIGLPLLFYGVGVSLTQFSKGGLHTLLFKGKTLIINHTFRSIQIPISEITKFEFQKVHLTIRQSGAASDSMEYHFKLNDQNKFAMGENAALFFIDEMKKRNITSIN
jgi:hypothetical protein